MKATLATVLSIAAGVALASSLSAEPTATPVAKKPLAKGTTALKLTPKLSPQTKLVAPRLPVPLELLHLRINDEGSLACQRGGTCTLRGRLGNTKLNRLSVTAADGKRLDLKPTRWTTSELTFTIPLKAASGFYTVMLTDTAGKQRSNRVMVAAHGLVGKTSTCATDADGDGAMSTACGGTDCDDNNRSRFPGNIEICDPGNVDEDCDWSTYGWRDADGDRHADAACCNGTECGSDCDDNRGGVHYGNPEVCNSLDDDCDGAIDEGVASPAYRDADGDLFGTASQAELRCCQDMAGWSRYGTDCDDGNISVRPGQGCP